MRLHSTRVLHRPISLGARPPLEGAIVAPSTAEAGASDVKVNRRTGSYVMWWQPPHGIRRPTGPEHPYRISSGWDIPQGFRPIFGRSDVFDEQLQPVTQVAQSFDLNEPRSSNTVMVSSTACWVRHADS
jgi:hypothetical protein